MGSTQSSLARKIYLLTETLAVELVEPVAYPKTYRVADTQFYIYRQYVVDPNARQRLKDPPDPNAVCKTLRGQLGDFDQYFGRYLQGDLWVYRAIPGSHYSWPALRQGRAEPEGTTDQPTFTGAQGNDSIKSSWVPGGPDASEVFAFFHATDVGQELLDLSKGQTVPTGVIIKVKAGKGLPQRICWMNSTEFSIQTPLSFPAFFIHELMIFKDGRPATLKWPEGTGPENLMKERPYGSAATKDALELWWLEIAEWRSRVTILGGNIQVDPPSKN